MAVMNTTRPTGSVGALQCGQPPNPVMPVGVAIKPGASPTNLPSHQPGIGLKPGTQTPPANVLQVVKQVRYLPFPIIPNSTFFVNCILLSPFLRFIVSGTRRSREATGSWLRESCSWRWHRRSRSTQWCHATADAQTRHRPNN